MITGMLWFDNNPKNTLTGKITEAAEYYRKKYGISPDLCLVNPGIFPAEGFHAGPILVRPLRSVLPDHLWIGVEEKLPTGTD
jgi:hypothetical protein